jgi:hypothetical protein
VSSLKILVPLLFPAPNERKKEKGSSTFGKLCQQRGSSRSNAMIAPNGVSVFKFDDPHRTLPLMNFNGRAPQQS